jgi:lysophospholipase L1-like esterase
MAPLKLRPNSLELARLMNAGWGVDKVVRDPSNPTQFLPAFDSGDHIHPNDAGYKAIADSIDLSLFKP